MRAGLIRNLLRCKQGQSFVEVTLITPLMLFLIFGVVEVGSIISTYLTLTHTTREGANLTSRGTDPNMALDAIIASASPTISNAKPGQWRIIYTQIVQTPGVPCAPQCAWEVGSQIVRGSYAHQSKIGTKVGDAVTLSGIENVVAGQTFHAIEAYYNYGPVVITSVADGLNQTFYDRTLFTQVSGKN